MRISPCSYLNPCHEPTPNISKRFKQLKCCQKVLVVITAIFATLGSVFMGGLGGLAAFRSLVDRFNPVKFKKDPVVINNPPVTENPLQLTETNQFCIKAAQKYFLDSLEITPSENTLEITVSKASEKDSSKQIILKKTDTLLDFALKLLAIYPTSLGTLFYGRFPSANADPFNGFLTNLDKYTFLPLEDLKEFSHFICEPSLQNYSYLENPQMGQFYFREGGDINIFFRLRSVATEVEKQIQLIYKSKNPEEFSIEKMKGLVKDLEKLNSDFDLVIFKYKDIYAMYKKHIFYFTYPLKIFIYLYEQFVNNFNIREKMKDLLVDDVIGIILSYIMEDLDKIKKEMITNWVENNKKLFEPNA